jgi:hypothetical protein
MPVEIRELVIHTSIVSRPEREQPALDGQRLAQLRHSIVQECLKALREQHGTRPSER